MLYIVVRLLIHFAKLRYIGFAYISLLVDPGAWFASNRIARNQTYVLFKAHGLFHPTLA